MTGPGEERGPAAEPGFEAAHQELEQIVERLERGDTSLDETIALWERGEALYRICSERLDAAHGRIEQLLQRTSDSE